MEHLATQPAGRGRLLEESIAGHRVGWFPASRMLFAEGHPVPDALAGFSDLPGAKETIETGLVDRGILPPTYRMAPLINAVGMPLSVVGRTGFAGCRRLDVTVDVERTSAVGSALLVGAASVDPGQRFKAQVHRGANRRIETVTWSGERSKVARIYDKGIESRSHGAGERVRLEDQRRFTRQFRPSLETLVENDFARSLFERRFEPLMRATKGITVTTPAGLVERVEELVREEELTPAEAAKLTGLVLLQRHGCELGSRTTRWRNRKAVERLGILIGDDAMEEVEIDLGAEVESAVAAINDAP